MTDTPPSSTLVYSYRRFSSGRQASGHSLERQTHSARIWCLERGFVLDESLALSDLGISAYTGDNVMRGAMGGFLAAAESGRVPKGSILLVESLDRISRASIPDAIAVLTKIVNTGVRVVSHIDNHEWNETTIQDTTSFMLSVLLFSRAHEESAKKAKRVSDQFQGKREAGLAVVSHGHGPGWAVPKPDRSGWEMVEDKAAAVLQAFEMAAAGHGGIAIARRANQEAWPLPWRIRKNTSTRWEHTGVSRLLRDRRVLGEWQPKKMVAGKMTNHVDPVLNYFPRAISDELWYQVQASLGSREGPLRIRGLKADIFSGIFYCSCGERMDRKPPTGRGYPRYYCLGRINGSTDCPGLAEKVLLGPVLSAVAQLEQSAFTPDNSAANAREELSLAQSRLADANARAERLLDALEESGHSQLLLTRLAAAEKDKADAETVITRARNTLAAVPLLDRNFGDELAKNAAKVVADRANVEGRHKVAQALSQVVKRIVWNGKYFMVHARNGATYGVNPPPTMLKRAKNRNAKSINDKI
jgi:DNA invertase Pin-like site-specific DNA recombinase